MIKIISIIRKIAICLIPIPLLYVTYNYLISSNGTPTKSALHSLVLSIFILCVTWSSLIIGVQILVLLRSVCQAVLVLLRFTCKEVLVLLGLIVKTFNAILRSLNFLLWEKSRYIEKIISEIEDPANAKDAMRAGLVNLRRYTDSNCQQVNFSFKLAWVFSVIGFIMLCISFYLGITNQSSYIQLAIPVISGVISQFIAGTFLYIYKSSSDKIDEFYKSLDYNQKYLVALEMTNELSTQDLRDKKIEELISKIIEK